MPSYAFTMKVPGTVLAVTSGPSVPTAPPANYPSGNWYNCPTNIVPGQWNFDGSTYTPVVFGPTTSSPSMLAQQALDDSDITYIRAGEDGFAFPDAWVTYRQQLRAIVKSNMGDLPTRPPYPSAPAQGS